MIAKLLGHRPPRTRLGRGEDGYVLALFALTLVVLLAFAGFSVDVGAWYARGSQVQRAVDAAAMAGVVYIPGDMVTTQNTACEVLAKNGIDCSGSDYDVDIEMLSTRRLKVTVRDLNVEAHFSKLFFDRMPTGIRRSSTAEYVLPVPLGSPESRFGTGDINFGGGLPRHWFMGAVSAFCSPKEWGDQELSWTDGQAHGGCPPPYGTGIGDPNPPQPHYDATGYDYYIDVPANNATITVRLFDVGFCHGSGSDPIGANGDHGFVENPPGTTVWNTPFNTEFRLYQADGTPLDDSNNPQFGTTQVYGANVGCDAWTDVWTIPANSTPAGRWRLNVRTQPGVNVRGHNNWGLWARRTGDTRPCSTLSSATCPKVYAKERMSITVARDNSTTAQFYLAEVDPVHVGKQLEIQLWDPGDGMNNMQILDPSGNPVEFWWRTVGETNDYPWVYEQSSCGPGNPCLDVSGSGPTPSNKPNRTPNGKFSDRLVQITVDLPNSFASYPNNWWQVKYAATSDVFDRTTWSAVVRGDPVHLVG